MTTPSQPNRSFTNEYRFGAVRLSQSIGTPAEAKQLGISDSALRQWDTMVRKQGESAFVDHDHTNDHAAELRDLRERVRQLEMERDIVKKATASIAKESK